MPVVVDEDAVVDAVDVVVEDVVEDVVVVVVEEAASLYTLSLLGPPQNSELFPLQTILQSEAGAWAPPLTIVFPQSGRYYQSH